MDTLTQGLLGATAAQLLLGKRLGHRAWIAGMAGGLLPDLDVVLQPISDPALPWELHRHFTHALVLAPLMGVLAVLPLFLFRGMRRERWLVAWAGVIGAITHGPLDLCTSYGTKILWPFSTEALTLDLYPIVDPLFTLALIVGIVAAARRRSLWPAVATWAFIALYTVAALLQQGKAQRLQEQLLASRGHEPARARVMPMPGSLLVWRSLYEHEGVLHADMVRSAPWSEPQFAPGGNLRLLEMEDALSRVTPEQRARTQDLLRRFSVFADGYVAWTPDDPKVVGDMRFTSNPAFESIWGIRVGAPPGQDPVAWDMRGTTRPGRIGALLEAIAGTHDDLRGMPGKRTRN